MHCLALAAALLAGDLHFMPSAVRPATPPPRLMSAERDLLYRQFFPVVDNEAMRRLLAHPDLLIYTDAEMPRAYQFWDGQFPGVHRVEYNISANGSEPYGNGNREFPWGAPAGTHRAVGVGAFRFLWLPRDEQGYLRPVVWHRPDGSQSYRDGYAWTFPHGAVLGEALTIVGPDGRDYTFELRVRRREASGWEVDVFRPFPTARSLAKRIDCLRPNWRDDPKLRQFCAHLVENRPMVVRTLADQQPAKRAFEQTMGIDELPAIDDPELVAELLTTTAFQSALGRTWREEPGGVATCAPTTKAQFHVIPANYDAGFVAVDSQSCTRCHHSANEPVRNFDAGRDWYGRIRGSDGIFSFHPFATESISGNGYATTVRMRSELESAGVIAAFDAARHSSAVYQALPD